VGDSRANLAAVFLLFAPMVLFNFTPGRVDHHGYEILVAGFGVYALQRMLHDAQVWPYSIIAAVVFAGGLWIGTEALPWLLLFIACLAVLSAWQVGFVLRNAALFGIALTAAMALVLPLALPPNEFSSRALSWFSGADVVFAALTGAAFILGWLLGRQTHNQILRLALIAALGLCAAALFACLVPDVWRGPFADYDSFNSGIALDNISEAQPLGHAFLMVQRHVRIRATTFPAAGGTQRRDLCPHHRQTAHPRAMGHPRRVYCGSVAADFILANACRVFFTAVHHRAAGMAAGDGMG
jgi:hypothetical protein